MRRLAIHLILLVLLSGACASGALKDLSVDSWMNVQVGSVKVGYQHISIAPDKLDGGDVYRLSEVFSIDVLRDGVSRRTTISQTLYLDETFHPIKGASEKDDDGVVTRAEARFLTDRIECTVTAGGKTSAASIPIPSGVDLSVAPAYLAGRIVPDPEKSIAAWSLDFFKPAMIRGELRADGRKLVEWNGAKHGVLIVRRREGEEEMIDWRLDSGQTIRTELPRLSTVMTSTTRSDALSAPPRQDLGRVAADRPIRDPRRASELSVRLTGMPDSTMALSDSRQTAVYHARDRFASYVIHAAAFDPARSAKLPIGRKDLAAYLAPAKGIESERSRHHQAGTDHSRRREERLQGRVQAAVVGEGQREAVRVGLSEPVSHRYPCEAVRRVPAQRRALRSDGARNRHPDQACCGPDLRPGCVCLPCLGGELGRPVGRA